jgi:hypothetical protein
MHEHGNSSAQRIGKLVPRVDAQVAIPRWLDGLYLDTPEEWDDPYRFFRR